MKIARFAIFLTGMMGLAIGGIMSISSLQSQQEEAVIQTNESLKSQAQIYVDQFFGTLEAVKANVSASPSAPLPYVTSRAVVKLNQGVPSEVESIDSTGTADLALEDRVLKALKEQVSLSDLQISKVSLGTYGLNDLGPREGIYVATPIYKINNGIVDPAVIEKINVALIDPVKAFGGFSKGTENFRNNYLLNQHGKVLAHTLNAYVGTDLKRIDSLKDTIENLFIGAQIGSVGRYQAVDGTKEQVAFIRVGTFPFAIGVEQKAAPSILSMAWASEAFHSGAARKNLGVLSILIGIALAFFSATSFWLSRELRNQISANAAARFQDEQENHSFPISNSISKIAPSPFAVPPSAAAPLEEFVETRAQLNEEMENAAEHANQLARTLPPSAPNTLEGIERSLVQSVAHLTQCSILYFRYHRRSQNLSLTAVAGNSFTGNSSVPNYTLMQAYVRKDIESQVESLADQGKVASITNYGPMSKLMISNLNVAHFEAWAVTSDPEVSEQSRWVGVVVVLQPGVKSAQARPAMAKLLRESGNFIYALSNKLRSNKQQPNQNHERPPAMSSFVGLSPEA